MNNEEKRKARKLAGRRMALAAIARELGLKLDEVRAALASAPAKGRKPAPVKDQPAKGPLRRRAGRVLCVPGPAGSAGLGAFVAPRGGRSRVLTWQDKLRRQGILPGGSRGGRSL